MTTELITDIELSPFHYSKYNFITSNVTDIRDYQIQYGENVLERPVNQMKLNEILNDIDIALKIELSIFEYSLIYCLNDKYDLKYLKPIYDDKIYNIILNLDPTNHLQNKTFKENLLTGKLNPNEVGFMSPAQIHPVKWNHLIKKKEYKEWRENSIAYSNTYKCRHCGESKCKISQVQTRSADEPSTLFISCMICHKTFKIG